MKRIVSGVILVLIMLAMPYAAMSKDKPKVKKQKKVVQVQVAKGYQYVMKEKMNFETTMFHLQSMLERQENEKAVFLLRSRIEYLKRSLLKVIADEGYTKNEKEKIKKLNKIERNWLEKKIHEVEG